jgi:hypothetical protein
MNTKIIVAHEAESSITTRIHPADVGELLTKMNVDQLKKCMDTYNGLMSIYRDKIFYEQCKNVIKHSISK